jgi:hypothetical protein
VKRADFAPTHDRAARRSAHYEIIRHVPRCKFLAITLPIATLAMVPSWAGPAQDKALWGAAGCRDGHPDTEAVKAALKLGADPSAPSKTARPISMHGTSAMIRNGG